MGKDVDEEDVDHSADHRNIPISDARIILEMEEVCYSEGIGPNSGDLILWIGNRYPELKAEFGYLFTKD